MSDDHAKATADVRYPDLEGQRVLVTGGASGLGLAMAKAFAGQGCRVALLDLDREGLDRALEALPSDALGHCGSVADEADVGRTFEAMDEAFGGVDVAINNAGIAMNVPTLELTAKAWQKALDVNLTGVFHCSQAAARRMIANGSGVIVNLASMYGVVAAPERLAYCATKSGVAMMTKALAIEWADKGIRVNAVAPGYVRTALVEELVEADRLDETALNRRTPLGRLGTVEEVADLAVFLASDKARYITGQVVGVDGGWTAYGYV
ncbi:SDR family oxidoreductase [Kaustia mangrovi]|uniref:SDR family oxidoreductase n=1 Tax=Kaustia mangrovi TaxID=2593653 RepID=A0A7S8C330_9HYPH|nr:SDR family NAD(P)-dependent oxidoreductase [Kaustia mangrovi]QPC42461.1 SDR family oxidoreductase [Kaustia mangrovi]